jgi:hypothetical protein
VSKKTVGDLRNFEGKQPKAVREFLEHNNLLDALVNPDFIVTAERVEAAAKAMLAKILEQDKDANLDYHSVTGFYSWEDCSEQGRQQWCEVATAAITAAGGIVPDEVVEVGAGWGAVVIGDEGLELAHEDYTNELSVAVHSGDRIYIVRADTSTASTRSADTSKDRRGIDRGK